MAKTLSIEERSARDIEFVRGYIENGGNATQAAITCGVPKASAGTVGHRLKNRLTREIEQGQKMALQDFSVKAVHALGDLLENCKSESVKLGCIKEILDRAGFKPVNRQEIVHMNEFEKWTDDELRTEWGGYRQCIECSRLTKLGGN